MKIEKAYQIINDLGAAVTEASGIDESAVFVGLATVIKCKAETPSEVIEASEIVKADMVNYMLALPKD